MLTSLLLLISPAPLQEPASPMPLRVEDVVRLVQKNGPSIRQAQLAALSAKGGVREAQGAFDPVFFADVTYSYLEQPLSGFFSTLPGIGDESESTVVSASQGIRGMLQSGATYSLSLKEDDSSFNYLPEDQANASLNFSFTQPLLRGGWSLTNTQNLITARIAQEKAQTGIQQANEESVQAAVNAYWDLALALEDADVKDFGLKMAKELRDVTQARFQVGAVAEVEVVQTEADIASRTDALLTAENTVQVAQDGLRLAIFGLDSAGDWELSFLPISALPEAVTVDLSWEDAFQVALLARSSLKQLRLDLEQAKLNWEVAVENTKPKLDFVTTGNSYSQSERWQQSVRPILDFDFPGYSAGFVFEIPFGNDQYQGTVTRTRYAKELAERTYQDAEHQVASEVRDAVRSVNYLSARVSATSQATRVATRQLDAEERRLQEGVSTNFQLLQFQNDLLTAKTAELGARTAYAKALAQLQSVQGLSVVDGDS